MALSMAVVGISFRKLLKATLKTPLSPKQEHGWETQTESSIVLLARHLWELVLTVLLFKGLGCVRMRLSSAQQKPWPTQNTAQCLQPVLTDLLSFPLSGLFSGDLRPHLMGGLVEWGSVQGDPSRQGEKHACDFQSASRAGLCN